MTRLYRSTRDRVMTGLAGGLSETIGMDSTLLRILLLVAIPFTGGAVIPVYFIAALIIPKEPGPYDPFTRGGHGGYGAYGGGHGQGYGPHGPEAHRNGPQGHGPYGRDTYDRGAGYGAYGKTGGYGASDSGLDAMMKDIEKKALQKEVEELKRKLAKYEKGEV